MKNKSVDENEIIIKCLVKLRRQFFPKDKTIDNGDFGIVSMEVLDTIEGEPQISKWGTITVTGVLCEMNFDETYLMIGREEENEKFGLQYKTIYINKNIDLKDEKAQKIFLNKILTDNQVKALYSKFENPIKLLEEENIGELTKAKGIGVPTAIRIIEKYKQSKDYSDAYVRLDKLGLTNLAIKKLVDSFGGVDILINKIEENPYILADEVDGIGWVTADEIALNSGLGEYSSSRVKAFIQYYFSQQANEGSTYKDSDDLLIAIEDNIGLDLPQDILTESLKSLVDEDKLWINEDRTKVALSKYKRIEENICAEIIRLNESNEDIFNYGNWQEKVKELEKEQGWEYTEEQFEGIASALKNNVTLVQGLAGTGKSSIVNGILKALPSYTFAQCALSGKASVNLTEVTGEEGFTIHRLLKYNPVSGFTYNKSNQLDYDIVILDEVSMDGAEIFYKLIQAIKTGSKLIMLGDVGQLESIGVGNIMKDLVESEYINIVNLTKIHRQAQKSAVITESRKIRKGEHIVEKGQYGFEIRGELQDLKLEISKDKKDVYRNIIDNFLDLYPTSNNIMELQVIVPMKERGECCTYKLNNAIQQIIRDNENWTGNHILLKKNSSYPYMVYEGDKVINLKNNYKTYNTEGAITPIFNGDMGIVKEIDIASQSMVINFQNTGEVIITRKHLPYIGLGYAITCHKSQGSGFKYVICGLDYSHYKLLSKEMVYTMLTRTKKYCVLCAENKALRYATTRSNVKYKQTFLKEFLTKEKENKTK